VTADALRSVSNLARTGTLRDALGAMRIETRCYCAAAKVASSAARSCASYRAS